MEVTPDQTIRVETGLRVAGEVDYDAMYARLTACKQEHQRVMRWAWIGALVSEFSNDELRVLCDEMSMVDVGDLRRLGLLAADEGFDGSKASRVRAVRNGREHDAKRAAQRAALLADRGES